jgi:hypothetical protein
MGGEGRYLFVNEFGRGRVEDGGFRDGKVGVGMRYARLCDGMSAVQY